MKTWNIPEISELNINETASGILKADVEFWPIFDKEQKPTTPDPVDDPS